LKSNDFKRGNLKKNLIEAWAVIGYSQRKIAKCIRPMTLSITIDRCKLSAIPELRGITNSFKTNQLLG